MARAQAEQFVEEVGRRLRALEERAAPAERDAMGRTAMEARRDYLEFARRHPTFERGTSRWADFAGRFRRATQQHAVMQVQVKEIPVSYTHLTLPTNREV